MAEGDYRAAVPGNRQLAVVDAQQVSDSFPPGSALLLVEQIGAGGGSEAMVVLRPQQVADLRHWFDALLERYAARPPVPVPATATAEEWRARRRK